MRQKIRLIAFDMDGTVLDDHKRILPETKEAFARAVEQGIVLLPATGRHFSGAVDVIREIDGVKYIMTCNGAGIYEMASGHCLFEESTVERSHNEEYTRLVPVMRKDLTFPAGNDGRIRRYFYKEVRKKAGNQEIEKSQTPMELKRTFLEPNAREERLTELYEKARYAKDSVTEEEISRWEKM